MILSSVTHLAKKERAKIIAEYVSQSGLDGVVIFGCGNGAQALRDCGLYVVDVSAVGDIMARRWWTPAEIAKSWPRLFDATSGHLPAWMMIKIGQAIRQKLGDIDGGNVPTGSGETITCLRWAYPDKLFVPIYNTSEATKYEPLAPLNPIVT